MTMTQETTMNMKKTMIVMRNAWMMESSFCKLAWGSWGPSLPSAAAVASASGSAPTTKKGTASRTLQFLTRSISLIQGGFFNWPPLEFAKCWPVSNRFRKNVRVPDWPPP